ncbi:MAG TPA: DNA polymerase III subunit gamma/tau [Ignavibacteriaceae bacterium]|nr:DNA polymerase III subunit gamma/tau [Ignavibacteriaceae bacterium]
MAYIVTARKWRPQKFSEVVGQEHITATLKNAIKTNRIAHAYLFTGPRGVGKTTTARILAKTLNCLNPKDAEPCNECEMCKSILNSQSLDIIEIDGASNRGIDEIRTLRESVKYAPTKGKYKVYIIDEVHMLTRESFNAFLKTLEEPPGHTIFIFATTDVHKVPLTIISRCQRFDFRRIQMNTIKELLTKIAVEEKIEIDDKTLTIIARKADGALRDAESYFDQVISFCGNKIDSSTVSRMLNLVDDELFFMLSDAVLDKNFKTVFEVTKLLYEHGWDFVDFMDGLTEHFRNILTVILTEKTELIETAEIYREKYINYLGSFTEGDLLRILNFLNKTQQELRYSQNQKLKVEISLSHLIGLEKTSTISEIISGLAEKKSPEIKSEPQPIFKIDIPENKSAAESAPPSSPQKNLTDPKSYQSDISAAPNLESIINRWEGFVNLVMKEKALILGPFLSSVEIKNLNSNALELTSPDPYAANIVENDKEYLAKKTLEFFGRKLKFIVKSGIKPNKEDKHLKISKSNDSADDPYVRAIISELGGEIIE